MALEVEYFTLTNSDTTNGYLILDGEPSTPTDVAMDLCGGTAQAIAGDFAMQDGTVLTWTGYNLDGTISSGDRVRVIYDRT